MKASFLKETFLAVLVLASAATHAATADDLVPAPIDMPWSVDAKAYELGAAYDTKKKRFLEAHCVEGDVLSNQQPNGSLSTLIRSDYADLVNTLGVSASARFRTSVIDTSASAEMTRASHDTGYAVTLIYKFDSHYTETYDGSKGKNITIKAGFADDVKPGKEKPFQQACGDEYVVSTDRVADLLVTVRVNFSNKEKADEFHVLAELTMNSGATSANVKGKFDQLAKSLDKHSSVDVRVVQIGGLPGLAGQSLCPVKDGKADLGLCGAHVMSCSMGKFEACESFLAEAIAYAGGSLATQLVDGKNPVNYAINKISTASYISAGQFPYPVDETENKLLNTTLTNLNTEFNDLFDPWLRANDANKNHHPRLSTLQTSVIAPIDVEGLIYLTALQKAVRTCYTAGLNDCLAANEEADTARKGFFEQVNKALAAAGNSTTVRDSKTLGGVIDNYITAESYAQFCDIADDKHLDVDYAIKTIDKWMAKTDPTEFDSENAKLDKCGEQQAYLERLTELNLSAADITTQASEMNAGVFASLKNLKVLSITNAKIRDVSRLATLPNLVRLDLGNNQLKNACSLKDLPQLTTLILENNRLSDVSCFGGKQSLAEIDIRGNGVDELACPASIRSCKNQNLATLINQSSWAREFGGFVVGMSAEQLASGVALVSGGSTVRITGTATGAQYKTDDDKEQKDIFSYTTTWSPQNSLFECDAVKCISVGVLKEPRQFATSTRLSSGEVVIAGGTTNTIEVYSATGQSVLMPDRFANPRAFHTATLLPHDLIVYAGGYETQPEQFRNRPGSSTIEVFNGVTKKIDARCTLRIGRAEHTATDIGGGKVLIIGGFRDQKMVDQMEIVSVRQNGNVVECSSQIVGRRMLLPRAGHAAIRNGGKVYVAGGFAWIKEKDTPKVEGTDSLEVVDLKDFSIAKSNERLSFPRGGLSAVQVADGRTLLIGGSNSDVLGYPYKGCISESDDKNHDKNHCLAQPDWGGVRVVGADTLASDKVDIFDADTAAIYNGASMSQARAGAAVVPIGLQLNTVLVLGGAGNLPMVHGTVEVLDYK